jgi:hypothetical protein
MVDLEVIVLKLKALIANLELSKPCKSILEKPFDSFPILGRVKNWEANLLLHPPRVTP